MDFLWTIALLLCAYFGYRWYTGLQAEAREKRQPEEKQAKATEEAYDAYEELPDNDS